jgi:hypothetical protein
LKKRTFEANDFWPKAAEERRTISAAGGLSVVGFAHITMRALIWHLLGFFALEHSVQRTIRELALLFLVTSRDS